MLELNPRTWPQRGRVGYCRSGERSGQFIFLQLGTEDRSPELAYWQAFFARLGAPVLEDDELFIDDSSGLMLDILEDLDVSWAPSDLDSLAEEVLFGVRAWMASNGALEYVDASTKRRRWATDGLTVYPDDPWAWLPKIEELA